MFSCGGFKLKKKADSGEEFLIEKKDPLVLPPDFSKLPNLYLMENKVVLRKITIKTLQNLILKKVFPIKFKNSNADKESHF